MYELQILRTFCIFGQHLNVLNYYMHMSNLSKKVFKPDPQLLVLVRNFVFTFLQLGKQNRLTDKQTIYENKLHTDIWLRIVNNFK